jgi:tetratricopeptide (TPR) repeat protein
MQILKKTSLVSCLVLSAGMASAQDYKAIQNAFSESYALEKKTQYTKALETIKTVYDESSYEINLRLGWLAYESGLFTESMAYYEKAINLKPYAIEARLGFVYPASQLGNWEQVKSQYFEILKIDPQNTVVNYRMGLIYYGKQDFTNALKHFEKVVNLYPFDYDSVIYYAWSNFKLGKLREAKVLFNKALIIKPNDSSALEGLGLIK